LHLNIAVRVSVPSVLSLGAYLRLSLTFSLLKFWRKLLSNLIRVLELELLLFLNHLLLFDRGVNPLLIYAFSAHPQFF